MGVSMFAPFKENWAQKVSPLLKNKNFEKDGEETCRLILETVNRGGDKAIPLIEELGGKIRREINLIPSLNVEIPARALPELAQSGYVLRIWQDTDIWNVMDKVLETTGSGVAQDSGYTGKGVVVAVLDTGIDPHDDLLTPDNHILAWNDIVNDKTFLYDDHGHGTAIAGVIAGNGISSDGKYKGMAPDARLVGVKVLDREGRGRVSDLISGLEWCLANQSTLNIKVVNLSIGTVFQGPYFRDPLFRSFARIWDNNIIICMADASQGLKYLRDGYAKTNFKPGRFLITVGNYNEELIITVNDNRLVPVNHEYSIPDLVAPGSGVISLKTGGGYDTFSGGSMATAIVTGGIAQLIQRWPHLYPDQIKFLLLRTAKDIGLGTKLQGAGLIDLFKALRVRKTQKSQDFEPVPVQNPDNDMLNMALNLLGTAPGNSQTNNNGMMLKTILDLLANHLKTNKRD